MASDLQEDERSVKEEEIPETIFTGELRDISKSHLHDRDQLLPFLVDDDGGVPSLESMHGRATIRRPMRGVGSLGPIRL